MGGSPGSGWYFGFDGEPDNITFEHRNDGGGNDLVLTSTGTYNDNQWHHAVVTMDSTDRYLYIDG